MFTMCTIALKLFRAAWANVLTSISIITISICLVMTMSVYIWNAHSQMKEDIQALYGEMDLMVGYNPDQNRLLSSQQIENFEAIPGVTKVSSVSLAQTNVENEKNTSFYTVGVENDDLVKSRYHFNVDLGPNEVVITENVARLFHKEVGDTLNVTFNKTIGDSVEANTGSFTIQEILSPLKGTDSPNFILMQNDELKTWMNNSNAQTAGMFALIKTEDNMATSVGTDLKQLDETLRVDVMSDYDEFKRNLQALIIFMVVLSFFILLISNVLLLSTFQLLFYKIKEQLMVFRALGASNKQVGRIVQLQLSTIIGVGVLLGTAVSLLIIKSWLPQLISLMKMPDAKTDLPMIFVLAIAIVSFLLLQLITQWQVHKSSSLLPLQIATENENLSLRWTKWKTIIVSGVAFMSLFLFLNAYKVGKNSGQGALMILIGTLLVSGIFLYLIPYLFTALFKFSLKPIRTVLGKEAYLACQQLMPQVRRNMPIILSIIGLMVILIFGSSLFKSVQQSSYEYINSQYETSIKIDNELNDPTITPDLITEIEALPSVAYAYARSEAPWITIEGENGWEEGSNFEAIDVEKYVQLKKLDAVKGDLKNGVIITERFARKHQLAVGDRIMAGTFDETLQQNLPIGELLVIDVALDSYNKYIDLFVDWSSFIVSSDSTIITNIMVEADNTEQALADLSYLQERWPALKITDKETFIKQYDEMTFQRWSLFVGVFVILISATCLGVLQTLLHSIYSKRADYAIQRLIGLSPRGLIKLILTQVLSFVLYGLAVGTFLGLLVTKLLFTIDGGTYDFVTLGVTSIVFLGATLIVFTLQGYWISRRKLANEMLDI
ncbi:ABC transporter permease [Lysinibacillus sp. CNPSo 3705]|uniref:ABC transporter permease n=1 Tax=Lysinibacillus sp. CNPSo 3705 TaxID=3028148 RepID=UPI0023642F22|nr:ABC transporter permease [Lysinibacillus sp. CNPSo 3705]MDD1502404.1 ABC transporter permease [Lysinibacillus sp. CNPSo 3705]